MIAHDIEFHNVVALESLAGMAGEQCLRLPRAVQATMTTRGRWNSQAAPGTELRFVSDAPELRVYLSTLEGDAELLAFRGDFLHSNYYIEPGRIHCIHLRPNGRLEQAAPEALAGGRFAPNVWRLMTAGYWPVFHGIEDFAYGHRPPTADEKPARRWLAYGSSITAGSGAARVDCTYLQQTARRLGVDVLNMGFGGACFCEPALADHFAARDDWDFATLEIGVNMVGSIEADEFSRRASYLLDTLLARHEGKAIVLITPYPNLQDIAREPDAMVRRQDAYRAILSDLAAAHAGRHVHLIDGRQVLPDIAGLCVDLGHPNGYGHGLMGEQLARLLAPIIG